jgi:uncharacterized membrane protein
VQEIEQKRRTELPLPAWVVLFVVGVIIEGTGRFFGWRENPSHTWHEWAPLAAATFAIFVCIFGYFRFAKGNETRDAAKKWTGIVIILLGLFMVGVSFLLKPIVPFLFG